MIAFQRGDYDRAIGLFDEAMSAEPGHAAPHYNMSLAYAKKLLFEKADEQMAEANRLALTRVRAALRHGIEGEESPLLDEPLPPAAMWAAAWAGPRRMPDLPRWMTPIFPGSLGALPFVSLAMLGLGLVLGRKIHLALPSFACTNCGRPVCRRCLRRIRRAAYCTPCGDALRRIQSTAYTKLVLDSRLRRGRSLTSILPQVADWALPGFRASRMGHPDLAALLAVGAGLGAAGLFNDNLPVTRLAWVDNGPSLWWPLLPGVLLFCAYLASTLTVLKLKPARTAVEEEEDELPLELPVQAERSRAA